MWREVMNNSSVDFLEQTLLQFKIESRDDVVELYKLFSAVEIDAYEKIIDSTNDFFDYLTNHLLYATNPKFKVAVDSAQNVIQPMANKFGHSTFESKFAETVLELSPTRKSDTHILDVGPSKMPYSSLAMATEAKKVSAMDKEFIFAVESLKNMNVDALEMFFDEKTSIDDFDFVVGKCPCSAIGHIAAACAKANKPYFLEFCNCAVPNRKTWIRDEHGNEVHTWKNVLPDIDPNVKFYDNYAFNLDASPEQVKEVVERIHGEILQSKRFKVPASKIIIPTSDIVTTTVSVDGWKKVDPTDEKPWQFDWD